jgi:hypothetical protein
MSTTPGHGYLLRDGRLSRVRITNSCRCDAPESHDLRVFSVLQISRLVKDGKLLFLPHPRLSKLGWFVVLSPHESLLLQPSVDSFHRIIRAMGKDSSGLNADEKSYLKTIERYSKEAFEEASSVSSDDERWHIVSSELQQANGHAILPDELGSGVVGRQLVIYITEDRLATTDLPHKAILYLWPTVFGPITTFSFYWRHERKVKTLRAYFESDDPKIDCAKQKPTLFAFVSLKKRSIARLSEANLRPIAHLVGASPQDVPCVRDFAAARLWAMDNLNSPSPQSSPEDWLRHGYIKRLAEEIREAIACIADNALAESIPSEAERMQVQGLKDCYRTFPYQQDVYAFCKAKLARKFDHFLRPFFEIHDLCIKAEAPRLGYQLQQLMTSALYSVEMTQSGTCIPSYDPKGGLDIVKIDADFLGPEAKSFWENLPWTAMHMYRETIGPKGFPAEMNAFYEGMPSWQGDVEEGKATVKQMMTEAFAKKSAVIRSGTYVAIDGGGLLVGVRLGEIDGEVMATFYDSLGGFVQASMNPGHGEWKLHTHSTASVQFRFCQRLQESGTFDGLSDVGRIQIADEQFDLWIERIELGIGASLAALIREFWSAERSEIALPQVSTPGNASSVDAAEIDLPRVRYVTQIRRRGDLMQ